MHYYKPTIISAVRTEQLPHLRPPKVHQESIKNLPVTLFNNRVHKFNYAAGLKGINCSSFHFSLLVKQYMCFPNDLLNRICGQGFILRMTWYEWKQSVILSHGSFYYCIYCYDLHLCIFMSCFVHTGWSYICFASKVLCSRLDHVLYDKLKQTLIVCCLWFWFVPICIYIHLHSTISYFVPLQLLWQFLYPMDCYPVYRCYWNAK
jgi:hypothetical protein